MSIHFAIYMAARMLKLAELIDMATSLFTCVNKHQNVEPLLLTCLLPAYQTGNHIDP